LVTSGGRAFKFRKQVDYKEFLAYRLQTTPKWGTVSITTLLNFWDPNHISGMAEAIVIKFCTQVGMSSVQTYDNKPSLKGLVGVM